MSNQTQQLETRSKRLRERATGNPTTEETNHVTSKRARVDDSAQLPRNRKAHLLAQDYVELASQIVLHPLSKLTEMGTYDLAESDHVQSNAAEPNGLSTLASAGVVRTFSAVYPLHHVSALGFIKSPIRRPSVVERWSPYEIAVFEASLAEYGKDFYRVQKEIGNTKTTTDIVEFYYIWKKTAHYTKWKKEYVPEYLDVSDNEETISKPSSKR